MELREALRTTSATRRFSNRQIDDATVAAILDDARFAPSGGNRQAWRVVVLKDPALRRATRDLYLVAMAKYVAQVRSGLVPFNPYSDRQIESQADALAPDLSQAEPSSYGFDRHLEEAPVLLAVLANLRALATVDRDLPRYSLAGGASVYPFAWSIILAARERGLGGVMTTMNVLEERTLLDLIAAPAHFALATLVVLGEPTETLSNLRRGPVSSFATIDAMDGVTLCEPA